MNKDLLLMQEIVCKYLPYYSKGSAKKHALENPSHYNVEHLVELAMAELGDYDFVDGPLYDFSDFSDSKTTTISERTHNGTSYGGAIPFMNQSGNVKIGALRVVIYNPNNQRLYYVFLPKEVWDPHMREWGNANKHWIRFRWNDKKDYIKKFKDYMCKDFEELAKMKSC
jgi:hypothetical protein